MKKFLVILMVLALSLFGVSAAFAYDVKVDEDTYAKVGLKMMVWMQDQGHGSADGTKDAFTDGAKQVRLYLAGQITNLFQFGTNIDFAKGSFDGSRTTVAGTSGVTDAWVTLNIAKELKLMTGLYRMAVSRVSLQDTYNIALPHTPAVADPKYQSNTTNMGSYRDAGLTAWGDLADGMVRYNLSAWDGNNAPTTNATGGPNPAGTNGDTRPTYSGRVVLNLMDPEKGYTNWGTYLGKAKIANIGVGYLTQGYGAAAGSATYKMYTVDAFTEQGPLDLEAAYFMYDTDSGAAAGVKPKAWYVQASYLIDKFQPAVRYESWNNDDAPGDYKQYVGGINYLIDGQNAKIALEYLKRDNKVNTNATARTSTSRDWRDITLAFTVQF